SCARPAQPTTTNATTARRAVVLQVLNAAREAVGRMFTRFQSTVGWGMGPKFGGTETNGGSRGFAAVSVREAGQAQPAHVGVGRYATSRPTGPFGGTPRRARRRPACRRARPSSARDRPPTRPCPPARGAP